MLPDIFQVKVMCGTAEFVSPEVVSYDYVSSNTDMWSIGRYIWFLLYIDIFSIFLDIRCYHLHSAVWLLTFHGGQRLGDLHKHRQVSSNL